MELVDTHAHLFFKDFNLDRTDVFSRAANVGVNTMIHVGTLVDDSKQAIQFAEQFKGHYAACGLHPHYASQATPEIFSQLKTLAQHPKVVAIGEIGLDFFRNESPRETQIDVFQKMIALAQESSLPIIVHSRDSHDEVLSVIRQSIQKKALTGVMHCFSGDRSVMERAIQLGFYISFAAPVTYKKNEELRACAKEVPSDRFVLETDCPFLPPQSKRGKRNEPSFLLETAQVVAEARGENVETIAQLSTANAFRLFSLEKA